MPTITGRPLTAADAGGNIVIPPLPGKFCFIVRASSPNWKKLITSNEICLNLSGIAGGGSAGDSGSNDSGPSDSGSDEGESPEPPFLTAALSSVVILPGDVAEMTVTLDTNVTIPPTVVFSQVNGPVVTLITNGKSVSFVAPDTGSDSFVTIRAVVTAGELTAQIDAKVKIVANFAFLGADGITGSNWEANNYGAHGYWIPRGAASGTAGGPSAYAFPGQAGNDDLVSLPSGVAIDWSAANTYSYIWANPSAVSAKGMFRPGESSGIESCIYYTNSVALNVTQTPADRIVRILRVYVTDHEDSRELDIVIKDKATGA